MPPITVKNWISPAISARSAAGSLPSMPLFRANTCVSTRPRVSALIDDHMPASAS
jgi:hypothetical protein